MNTIFKVLLAGLFVINLNSCSLPEPVQPNYLGRVAELLPEIQQNTAFFQGMDIGRFPLIWMQQLGGVAGFDLLVDKYEMNPEGVQRSWTNYYTVIHPKIISAITNAHEAKAPAYMGICRLLLVLNMQLVTDIWGDVPYEWALGYAQGHTVVAFTSQQKLYGYLVELVNLAIVDFQTALNDQSPRPQANDVIFGGNLQNWLKAARLLKIRVHLRLANKNNDYSVVAGLIQDGNLFESNADDMQFSYPGDLQNPYYFNDNVTRNSRVGLHFVNALQSTQDPRLPIFVKPAGSAPSYVGTAPGAANTGASFIGPGVASKSSPTFILTYVEQKFIEAEVRLRIGQQGLADQAFEQAVKASLMKFNVSNVDWENQHASVTNVTLQKILEAKYLALFLNPEVWTDYRRTGFPALAQFQGPSIPRRFLYPQNEVLLNSGNVPAGVTIFSRVWWDSL